MMEYPAASRCFLTFCFVLLMSCSPAPTEDNSDPAQRPVKLAAISGSAAANAARYPAVINAGQTAELSFPIGGILQTLPVSESDRVSQGDVIARLDPRNFELAVASAKASFDSAQDEFERSEKLAAQNAISESALAQLRSKRDVAKAQLDSARKTLADTAIVAPFAGTIASVPVREQQTVSAGALIATVINVGSLEAKINLPASVLANVPSQSENVRHAQVILEAAPDAIIDATFSEANLVADATSQTYEVTFVFTPPSGLLILPGMNATVIVRVADFSAADSAVPVPIAAVQSDGDGRYVWLYETGTQTVTRRNVEALPGVGENVMVKGLMAGDQIVAAGGAYLSEGQAVRPWTE